MPRQLVQAGFAQQTEGGGPASAYLFYYWNQPNVRGSKTSLRVAAAPVYADAELGAPRALGPRTDFAIGVAGGGFGDSYTELRRGGYHRGESFTGHGVRGSVSLYHLFNPGRRVPLHGLLRLTPRYAAFEKDRGTAPNFSLPPEERSLAVRVGLRMGGVEPVISPRAAAEASLWYESRFLSSAGDYGFSGDRRRSPSSHLYWARQLFHYTFDSGDALNLTATEGASTHADRFTAYRLGGMLPFTSEFPLALPGYSHQELSARRFVLLSAARGFALGGGSRWTLTAGGAGAWVDDLPGVEQRRRWHASASGDVRYRSPGEAWQFLLGYGYGATAQRPGRLGAHAIGFMLQYDLRRSAGPFLDMRDNPYLRGLRERLFGR